MYFMLKYKAPFRSNTLACLCTLKQRETHAAITVHRDLKKRLLYLVDISSKQKAHYTYLHVVGSVTLRQKEILIPNKCTINP